MTYSIVCPYCSHAIKVMDYEEGYTAMVCTECNRPFVKQTTMTPVFVSYALLGVGQEAPTLEEVAQDIDEDPEEILCVDCGKPISPNSDFRLCEDCLKDDEATDEHLEPRVGYYWPSKKDTLFCALCGEYFDDHGVEDGKCPEKNDKNENQQLPISTNSVFLQCPMSKNTTYRLDGDHVEVKYKKSTPVTTTRSDIHMLCEEDNPTSSIKELLGPDANTNKVAALNAVVRAVKAGLVEV